MKHSHPKPRIPTLALVAVLSTVLAAACGKGPAATAAHSPAPSASVAATSSGPLDCRLPVVGFHAPVSKQESQSNPSADLYSQQGTGGFFDFKTGTYTAAADSNTSYVASARAWLPVQPQAISPDGTSYVVTKSPSVSSTPPASSLYLVDVRTKAQKLLFTAPDGDGAYVIAYTSDGVYVDTLPNQPTNGRQASDLLLIDPVSGSHHSVPGGKPKTGVYQLAWMTISGGAAWGMALTFPNGQSQPYVVTLERLDIQTGAVADWFTTPSPFRVDGLDANDHPILALFAGQLTATLTLVSAPNRATTIQPEGGTYAQAQGQGLRDSHGTWFGSEDGSIWLYSAGSLKKVATIPPQPGATNTPYDPLVARAIAGPCV